MSARVLMAALALTLGCAASPIRPMVLDEAVSAPRAVAAADGAFERQVHGHLARVAGCYDEARRRDPQASGLVAARFVVSPAGHVSASVIDRDTSADPELAACVRTRIGALYFDPAPGQPTERSHEFRFCPASDDAHCRLGPVLDARGVRAVDGPAVAATVRDLLPEISRCNAESGGADGEIVSIEVNVEPDGRIMSGRALGEASQVAGRCALRPLLGARVRALEPSERTAYRLTFVVPAHRGAPTQLSRSL